MRDLSPSAVVIVPRAPGPLRRLDDDEPTQDDLDAAIGELFGPEPADRAGRADVVLVVIGGILMAASLPAGGGGLLILGGLLVALGLALPLQAGIRSVRRRRLSVREQRRLASGYALDVTTPISQGLVEAYSDLLALGDSFGSKFAGIAPVRFDDALVAAHLALVEVASLLGGRQPEFAAEKGYVRERTAAITRLSTALREAIDAAGRLDSEAERPELGSLVRARAELEAETGVGSLEDLHVLTRMARRGVVDAPGR